MVHLNLIGRTAKIVKPYEAVQRTGRNGAFESKMVMFSIATDRDYKSTVTNADGTISQERKTDFFVCRATGPIADLFNKYCSAIKEDGKLVSRRLYIQGHLEKYQATRTEQVQLPNGQVIQVNLPEEREVIVVESIEFLDANPVKTQAQVAQVIATVPQTPQALQPQVTTAPQVAQVVTTAVPQAPQPTQATGDVAPF